MAERPGSQRALLYKFSEEVAIGDPDGEVLVIDQHVVAFHAGDMIAIDDIRVVDTGKMGGQPFQ